MFTLSRSRTGSVRTTSTTSAAPLNLLKKEQDRIRTSLQAIEAKTQAVTQDLTTTERHLRLALDLVEDCAQAYRDAPSSVKKLVNQVSFERIEVIDQDLHAVMNEPFASLTEWAKGATLETEDNENGDSDGVAVQDAELAGVHTMRRDTPVFSALFLARPRWCPWRDSNPQPFP